MDWFCHRLQRGWNTAFKIATENAHAARGSRNAAKRVRTDSASARNASADERNAWICARVMVVCEWEWAQGMDGWREMHILRKCVRTVEDSEKFPFKQASATIEGKGKQWYHRAEDDPWERARQHHEKRTRNSEYAIAAPLRWPFGGVDPTTRGANRQWFRTRPAVMLLLLVLPVVVMVQLMSMTIRPNELEIEMLPLLPMPMQVRVPRQVTLVWVLQSSPRTSAMTSEKTRRVRLSLLVERPDHYHPCQCYCYC
jgi:hypothetical protein